MLSIDCGKSATIFSMSWLTLSRDDEFRGTKLTEEDIPFIQDELDNVTTVIYLLIEGVRYNPKDLEAARIRIRK